MNTNGQSKSETLPKAICQALKKLDERKQEVLGLVKAVETVEAANKQFKSCIMPPMVVTHTDVQRNGDVITMAMIRFVSEIQPILKFFADRGFRQTADPEDNPTVGMRRWTCGQIGIMALIGGGPDESGKQCRYVEVGKKEVPIYELQCDETQPASPPTAPRLRDLLPK